MIYGTRSSRTMLGGTRTAVAAGSAARAAGARIPRPPRRRQQARTDTLLLEAIAALASLWGARTPPGSSASDRHQHLPEHEHRMLPNHVQTTWPLTPPAAAAHAAAARRACTRLVAHAACYGHMPAPSRRHDPISTRSSWGRSRSTTAVKEPDCCGSTLIANKGWHYTPRSPQATGSVCPLDHA